METVIAVCGAVAAICGVVLFVLKMAYGRRGKITEKAEKACDLVREGEENAQKFQADLAKGDAVAVGKRLDDVCSDLAALLPKDPSKTSL